MPKRPSKSIEIMKPLFRWATFLALVPPYDTDDTCKLLAHKCRCIFFTFAILCAHIYTLDIGEKSRLALEEPTTVFILSRLSYAIATASTIFKFLSGFWNIEAFKLFIRYSDEVNRHFKKGYRPSSRNHVQLLVVHCLIACMFAFDAALAIPSFGFYIYSKVMVKIIEDYLNMVVVLLIYNYLMWLKEKFEYVNAYLEECVKLYFKYPSKLHIKVLFNDDAKHGKAREISAKLRSIRKVNYQLLNLISLFNKTFGWYVLLIFGAVVLAMLEMIDKEMLGILPLIHTIDLALWVILVGVMGVVVAVTSDMTTKEAQRTAAVCYHLLLEVPSVTSNIQDRILREELVLLAQQATHQCPRISAAGFFNVDYTTLFGLFGTVTSYVIVLMQIKK